MPVTNGVHMPTWVGPELRSLYDAQKASLSSFNKPELTARKGKRASWDAIDAVPDHDVWSAHQAQKARMIEFASERLVQQHTRYGESPEELEALSKMLDPQCVYHRICAAIYRLQATEFDPNPGKEARRASG